MHTQPPGGGLGCQPMCQLGYRRSEDPSLTGPIKHREEPARLSTGLLHPASHRGPAGHGPRRHTLANKVTICVRLNPVVRL